MGTHANKTQENNSKSVANAVSQKHNGGAVSTVQFDVDRLEAIQMRKIQEMADQSPQIMQAKVMQQMANNFAGQQQHIVQKASKINYDRVGLFSNRDAEEDEAKARLTEASQQQAEADSLSHRIRTPQGQEQALTEAMSNCRSKILRSYGKLKIHASQDEKIELEAFMEAFKTGSLNLAELQNILSSMDTISAAQDSRLGEDLFQDTTTTANKLRSKHPPGMNMEQMRRAQIGLEDI